MNPDLQAEFEKIQELLKSSATGIANLLGGESVPPPAAKARHEAVTKLEEAYMWLANGVHALISLEEKVGEAAQEMANEAAAGKDPSLKVLD